jgi:BirA family transcriptional regulator, biotin operon repressor / biotin---[acetyl-CoA-carboxylase] ligase
MSRPSLPPLDAARLAAADPELLPGVRVEVVEETTSTNALVAERARAGEAEGLVVVAERQSAGRGRLDRAWTTPYGTGLTFSVLLRPGVEARLWPWLPLLTGYAVDKALKADGFEAAVKWPNDVLLGAAERKVAGILVERVETPDGPAAVVGIGLNVAMGADELPVETATSLAIEAVAAGGEAPERTTVLLDVLASLWEAYAAWHAGGEAATARLRESYVAACATIGRAVRVELPGGVLEGTATGVDEGGQLLVDADGEVATLSAGDVVHVRALQE